MQRSKAKVQLRTIASLLVFGVLAVCAFTVQNQMVQQAGSIRALNARVQSLERLFEESGGNRASSQPRAAAAVNAEAVDAEAPVPIVGPVKRPRRVSPDPLPGLFTAAPVERSFYGGAGDAAHLGGFTQNDTEGQAPSLWSWMLKHVNVHSMMDIGCGRGISTKWFQDHGAEVLCIEGSSDAINRSLLDKQYIVHHDVSRGPWWPKKTYDAIWGVEFLEHVGRHYIKNYLPILDSAALIFVTHSTHGGYHHVEVHDDWWWKARMTAHGFVFSQDLTTLSQAIGRVSNLDNISATHIWKTMQVYINPRVASLPEHDHLFGSAGCYNNKKLSHCSGVDQLPDRYLPSFTAPLPHDALIEQVQAGFGRNTRDALLIRPDDYTSKKPRIYFPRIGPVDTPH